MSKDTEHNPGQSFLSDGVNAAVKITILTDNRSEAGLDSEHGFSAWIEASGITILFDTGQGSALAGNSFKLGVDLSRTDHLVLSHGHYDHGGGIVQVLKQAPASIIHLHPEAVISRYALDPHGCPRFIGLPREVVKFIKGLSKSSIRWTTGPAFIAPGIGLTGPIPRNNPHEDPGGPFFTDPKGCSSDLLPDDQALWVETPKGLIVVTGCAHSGIINTLHHVMKTSGNSKIHAVMGGFHLLNASRSRLDETMDQLLKISPQAIFPCHCTGNSALRLMETMFSRRLMPCRAGTSIYFGESVGICTSEPVG